MLLKSSILAANKSLRIFNITKMAAKRSQRAILNGQYRVFKLHYCGTAVHVQTMEDDSMNELSLGILVRHESAVNLVKIYNKQMILHCCCASCAAVSRVKLQVAEGDREISRDLKPAKE